MDHMSYNNNRVSSGRGSSSYHASSRWFMVTLEGFFVSLHKRFRFLFRIFEWWKLSCGQALRLLKKVFHRRGGFKRNNRRNSLVREERIKGQVDCRVASYGRNNSFYAEDIADSLEFIKRTSISSMDQIQDPIGHIQDTNS